MHKTEVPPSRPIHLSSSLSQTPSSLAHRGARQSLEKEGKKGVTSSMERISLQRGLDKSGGRRLVDTEDGIIYTRGGRCASRRPFFSARETLPGAGRWAARIRVRSGAMSRRFGLWRGPAPRSRSSRTEQGFIGLFFRAPWFRLFFTRHGWWIFIASIYGKSCSCFAFMKSWLGITEFSIEFISVVL